MRKKIDREVELFLSEAESRGACLESVPGHSHRMLETRVRSGLLVSPLPHLYARASTWAALPVTEKTLHIMRGLHVLHPEWILCGTSAAIAYGMSVSNYLQDPIEVCSKAGSGSRGSSHILWRHMRGEAPVITNGVPVTSLQRTVCDCARVLSFREGLAVVDSCLHQRLLSPEELTSQLEVMRRGRYHGINQARMTLSHANARSQNGGESIARAAMFELGFETPELQAPLVDPLERRRVYFVDYRWVLPDGKVVLGELDGGEKYADPAMNGGNPLWAMRHERRRESRISVNRPAIMRFSLEEVGDTAYFNALLETYGVPRDHEPLIEIPSREETPVSEVVPVEVYGV